MIDWCDKCEEMMQPYLDGSLSDAEVAEAQKHLELCSWCAKRSTSRSAFAATYGSRSASRCRPR